MINPNNALEMRLFPQMFWNMILQMTGIKFLLFFYLITLFSVIVSTDYERKYNNILVTGLPIFAQLLVRKKTVSKTFFKNIFLHILKTVLLFVLAF